MRFCHVLTKWCWKAVMTISTGDSCGILNHPPVGNFKWYLFCVRILLVVSLYLGKLQHFLNLKCFGHFGWIPLLFATIWGWPWRGKGRYNLKGFILCVRYKKWSTNSFGECLGDSLGLRIAWSDGMDGLLWFLWLFQSCHSWWNLRKRIRFGKNNQSEHAGILVDTLRFLFTLVRTPCILHPVLFLEVWAGTSKRDIQHLWSS